MIRFSNLTFCVGFEQMDVGFLKNFIDECLREKRLLYGRVQIVF